MAKIKEPPKSDRIRMRDRLDQRMANNPARRKMRPTEWAIKGELFMNCSCDVFCPFLTFSKRADADALSKLAVCAVGCP